METKYGTTYNSYFINAEKKAVIDTVKEGFWPEYREKLLSLTDPSEIEYIICNHTEPDHSGSLGHLLGDCSRSHSGGKRTGPDLPRRNDGPNRSNQ